MKNLIALLLVTLALAGCETVTYQMQPPATESGRMCVTQCGTTKEVCRGNEVARAKSQRDTCERNALNTVNICLLGASTKEAKEECQKKKPSCYVYENTARCDTEHRACFTQCGGTVIEKKS